MRVRLNNFARCGATEINWRIWVVLNWLHPGCRSRRFPSAGLRLGCLGRLALQRLQVIGIVVRIGRACTTRRIAGDGAFWRLVSVRRFDLEDILGWADHADSHYHHRNCQ